MNKDLENPRNKGMNQARHLVLGKGRFHTTYPVYTVHISLPYGTMVILESFPNWDHLKCHKGVKNIRDLETYP